MKQKIKLAASLLFITITLSGCIFGVKQTSQKAAPVNDGGIYISNNKGEAWTHNSLIYRVNEPSQNFNNVDILSMTADPNDPNSIYLTTLDQGIYYTYDGGKGWHQTLSGKGRINAVAVTPKDSCTIYAAISNRVYKSLDCNRHWEYKLIETRSDPNNQITALAVDYDNPKTVYAGTSGRGLFRSDDAGQSWRSIKIFEGKIINIYILPKNSNIIYVSTQNKGIFKTTNKGQEWQNIFNEEIIKKYKNILAYQDLILDPTVDDGLFYASSYGLFRSKDGGDSWTNIKLLTPPNSKTIRAVGINPKNTQELFYTVDTVLYQTIDGGVNWITKALPSSRIPEYFMVDPENTNKLILGIKRPPK